jgi:acetyl-CoA carboxylase biotin carboxyl carrier protein
MMEIHAEIVGSVIVTIAQQGQELSEGDTIMFLESMKMEIPVIAESAGTVTRIVVRQGDFVREGDLLAVLEQS